MKLGSDVATACHMFHTQGDKHGCVSTDTLNENWSFKKESFNTSSHYFCFVNLNHGVVISGQEIRSEGFVDPRHMTGQRRSKRSVRLNELSSSGALRPKGCAEATGTSIHTCMMYPILPCDLQNRGDTKQLVFWQHLCDQLWWIYKVTCHQKHSGCKETWRNVLTVYCIDVLLLSNCTET